MTFCDERNQERDVDDRAEPYENVHDADNDQSFDEYDERNNPFSSSTFLGLDSEDKDLTTVSEIATIDTALDSISDALDKLEQQNDQLREQMRSLFDAAKRIKDGLETGINSFGSTSGSQH